MFGVPGFFLCSVRGGVVRILCNVCGQRAATTKTNRLSINAVDIYLTCSHCGHRFVWSAGFKHSLTGSKKEKKENLMALLNTLDPNEKRDLLHSISVER